MKRDVRGKRMKGEGDRRGEWGRREVSEDEREEEDKRGRAKGRI